MKVNIKILIICILIILSVIPATYAYWTDIVNSKVNISIVYDANLNVLNVPVPEVPLVEELLPQPEEVLNNGETGINEVHNTEVLSPEVYDIETEGVNSINLNSEKSVSSDTKPENVNNTEIRLDNFVNSDAEAEVEDNEDLNSDSSDIPDLETEGSEKNINSGAENFDIGSEDIQDSHVE